MTHDFVKFVELQHLQILVYDLDYASEFYREVFGFIEMQTHRNLHDSSFASWFGMSGKADEFGLDFRFMFYPDVLSIKLVSVVDRDVETRRNQFEPASHRLSIRSEALGPVSMVVDDLDETYKLLKRVEEERKYPIKLFGAPQSCDPITETHIEASKNSALYGQTEILEDIRETFKTRANFGLLDPFGVNWIMCRNVI
jgi:catechol 2,3-dioxygenase-like lactoylglutathione lyase family enzyme